MTVGVRTTMAAAGVIVASVAVSACSGPASGNPAQSHDHQPASSSAHTIALLDDTAGRALAVIKVPGEIFGLAGRLASPLSGVARPMTTDGGIWVRAGRYVLAFECVGAGQIEAATWIGKARAHLRATCQGQPTPVRLYLTAPKAGAIYMQLTATKRETVAVAAREGRLSGGT
jgi:hypothetical protein